MSLPTIILNGFFLLFTLSGLGIKESEIRAKSTKVDSLNAVVNALSKPPKKTNHEFQKKETEPHQHQYDDLRCSICGHVLRDGRRIYLDKKVEELDVNSKKELERCNSELELERKRLSIEKKRRPKSDTVYKDRLKHDTIVELRGIKPVKK